MRNRRVGKCQRNGVNRPETSSSTLAIQSDLISVEGWAVTDVVGLAPRAFLKAGRSFWNNNSNMGSNLSEWIFFTSNALNSNFIQDGEVNLIIITEIAFFFFLPCTILFGTEEPGLTCPTGIKTCAQWGARKHNRRMVITNSAFWWDYYSLLLCSSGKGHSNFSTFFI